MGTRDYTDEELYAELLASVEGTAGADHQQGIMAARAAPASMCASYRRIERAQWRFVQLYQWLIWALAVAAGGAVVVTIVLALTGAPWQQAALSGATAAVTGGLIAFPVRQRQDARREQAAALRALKANGCSSS